MTIDAEITQTLEHMPESIKQELLHYAQYLITNYSEETATQVPKPKKRRSGILQGTFVLPLADDFDAPLDDCEAVKGLNHPSL